MRGPATGGAWFALPQPFKYGLSFDARFILPFGFIYLVTAIETMGDLTACSELSGEPTAARATGGGCGAACLPTGSTARWRRC